MPMLKLRRTILFVASGIVGVVAWILLSLSGVLLAQTVADPVPEWQKAAGGQLSFEVASIKLADSAKFTPPNFALDFQDSFSPDPNPNGRLIAQFPLEIYIEFAYKLPSYPRRQMETMLAHAPKWVSTDRYAINALAEGSPTKDQMRLMLQSLLADRFKLAAHFEHQEARTRALVLDKPGKTGAKLYPHSNGPPCDVPSDAFACNSIRGIFKPDNVISFGGRDLTMAQITAALSGPPRLTLELPLVDQTGLEGRFDFSVEFTRDPAVDDPTTYLDAVQDQLGLKLKATTVLLDTLVIDHIERPSEN